MKPVLHIQRRRGSALLVTLWITAALGLLLGVAVSQTHVLSRTIRQQHRLQTAQSWSRGGVDRILSELFEQRLEREKRIVGSQLGFWVVYPPVTSEEEEKVFHPAGANTADYCRPWDAAQVRELQELPEAIGFWIAVEVTAEDSRLPLKRFEKQSDWSRIPGIDSTLARTLELEVARQPYRCLDELLLRPGFEKPEYFTGNDELPGLRNLLTPFSDGTVYINGVSIDVLRSLPGIDADCAREFMLRLKKAKEDPSQYFHQVEEVQHVIGVTPEVFKQLNKWLRVQPGWYRVCATACVDGVLSTNEAVVQVDGSDRLFELHWRSGG